MTEFLRLLAGTVQLRPYVFVLFGCYLFVAVTRMGWRRTGLYTILAYLIAFVCEFSSIHNGFPFGLYHYIQATRDRELWIAGVPFMDSLSFAFLSYVSWEVANLIRLDAGTSSRMPQMTPSQPLRASWTTALLAGMLMMYLDVVIDPLTLQGAKWFLGQIYYYPNGGVYFGVPIANFLGWWFVGFLIVMLYGFIEPRLLDDRSAERGVMAYRFKWLGAPLIYFGVLAFNLAITFWIGEIVMGAFGTLVAVSVLFLFVAASLGQSNAGSGRARMVLEYPNESPRR